MQIAMHHTTGRHRAAPPQEGPQQSARQMRRPRTRWPDGTTYEHVRYITGATVGHFLRCMNHRANIGGDGENSFEWGIAEVNYIPKRT